MLSLILIVIAAIFFTGIINRVKSIASGRKGPGILQPVKDVIGSLRSALCTAKPPVLCFRLRRPFTFRPW
jgi:formate hydrogenlyase subunit 4